jgi:hypothetical protein
MVGQIETTAHMVVVGMMLSRHHGAGATSRLATSCPPICGSCGRKASQWNDTLGVAGPDTSPWSAREIRPSAASRWYHRLLPMLLSSRRIPIRLRMAQLSGDVASGDHGSSPSPSENRRTS